MLELLLTAAVVVAGQLAAGGFMLAIVLAPVLWVVGLVRRH